MGQVVRCGVVWCWVGGRVGWLGWGGVVRGVSWRATSCFSITLCAVLPGLAFSSPVSELTPAEPSETTDALRPVFSRSGGELCLGWVGVRWGEVGWDWLG